MGNAKETEHSEARLRELGFDPGATPEQAIATLQSIRAAAGDGPIAHALGAIATLESAAMLAEMEAGATGAARREIRRALFRTGPGPDSGCSKPFSEAWFQVP